MKPYTSLPESLYHKQSPQPLDAPKAGHFNLALAKKLGLDMDYWQKNWVSIIGGEIVPDDCEPLAMAYAGHQFGVWAGQLGDGRGLLLTQIAKKSENPPINKEDQTDKKQANRQMLWDLHLKGAGQTPYSRMGDGRAVLRSTIREYLAGHALNALGIASSNGLGFVSSNTKVRRETLEQGACMIRVADSHIRLGHFEWINAYDPESLAVFTDYVIETHYPEAWAIADKTQQLLAFANSVVNNTAKTIADWQLVGFAHGVMNTDNLSITGSTLDFGPYGFMQRFDPAWINNHSDVNGRYVYQNQPAIAHWNLSIWLGNLLPLAKQDGFTFTKADLSEVLNGFEQKFLQHYQQGMAKKVGLGIDNLSTANTDDVYFTWAMAWLQLLQDEKLDYTNAFIDLTHIAKMILEFLQDALDNHSNHGNVDIHLQNQLVEKVGMTIKTLTTRQDIDDLDNVKRFDAMIQDYCRYQCALLTSKKPSKKTLQTDTDHISLKVCIEKQQQTLAMMQQHNPLYVLRNDMVQTAIVHAEQGDFTEVERLFTLLSQPYELQTIATKADTTPPAKDAKPIVVSCSS